MRHQRNPDVIFDFVKKDKYLTEDKPYVIYDIIETLLPDGAYRSEEEPGGWLELYVYSDADNFFCCFSIITKMLTRTNIIF